VTDQGPWTGAGRAAVRTGRRAVDLLWSRLLALGTATGEPRDGRQPRLFGIDLVRAFDLALAVVVLGSTYAELDQDNGGPDPPFADLTILVVAAAMAIPAVLRDRRPSLAWAISLLINGTVPVGMFILTSSSEPPEYLGGLLVFLYCHYTLASRVGHIRILFATSALGIGAATLLYPDTAIPAVILVTAATLVGANIRYRRRAQRRLVEQERRHQSERAVLEERQRIARELHDVVAHHMSVIAIQAEAAPYRVSDPPSELVESFIGIRSSALDGLSELRRILGVLRAEDAAGETAPQPGLERIDELIDNARSAGLTVTTAMTGPSSAIPPAAGLSAYRILQEALSNAMRHAPRSSVHVEIAYGDENVRITVANGPAPAADPPAPGPRRRRSARATEPAPPADAPGAGHGLVGMRERVALMGGELTAAPTPHGGFAVEASLPLRRAGEDGDQP
jgi:signal transduction histidine kinase